MGTKPIGPPCPAVLRHRDQSVVALVVLVSLGLAAGAWIRQGGHRGHLVDIEHVRPRIQQFSLDVNAADWPEWTLLPGVGETLARRIVEYRQQRGPFERHEDLLRVRGIGPQTLKNIRTYLLPVGDRRDQRRE